MAGSSLDPALMTERWRGPWGTHLGIEFVEVAPDRVRARLPIRDELRTVGGALHGGTLMAFADTVGAVATVLNLPAGAEHHHARVQDQFLRRRPVRRGAHAESTPLHRASAPRCGRRA